MWSRNLLLILAVVLLGSFIFNVSAEEQADDFGLNDVFLEFFKNTFSFIPKFSVLINYDFSIYDRLHTLSASLVSCGGAVSLDSCLSEQIAAFNKKETKVSLSKGFCASETEEFSSFFTLVHYLESARVSSDDDCVFSVSDFKGTYELSYNKSSGNLSSASFSSVLGKDFFGTQYQSGEIIPFAMHNKRMFYLKDDKVLLLAAADQMQNEKKRCTFKRTIVPFCAVHKSVFGDIEIKFALDFWNAPPPRMGEIQFNGKEFAKAKVPGERTVIISWSKLKDGAGNEVADLAGYHVYCSAEPFTTADALMLSLERTDLSENYQVELNLCGKDPFVIGGDYYFAVTAFDHAGQEYKDNLYVSDPVIVQDTLAPGLVPAVGVVSQLEKTYLIEKNFLLGDDTTIVWKRPTINEDFSSLVDLAGYHIFYTTQLQSAQLRFLDTSFCGLRFECIDISSASQISYVFNPAELPYDAEGKAQMVIMIIPRDASNNYLKEPDVWYAKYEQKLSAIS